MANSIYELGAVVPSEPASASAETTMLTQLVQSYNTGTPSSPFNIVIGPHTDVGTLNVGSAVPVAPLPAVGSNSGNLGVGGGQQDNYTIDLGTGPIVPPDGGSVSFLAGFQPDGGTAWAYPLGSGVAAPFAAVTGSGRSVNGSGLVSGQGTPGSPPAFVAEIASDGGIVSWVGLGTGPGDSLNSPSFLVAGAPQGAKFVTGTLAGQITYGGTRLGGGLLLLKLP
jgi:hypothetical protein